MRPPFHRGDGVTIYHANALALPLPDESVDLIITSPPYFGLRSYEDDGQHYEGQIGDEATPGEFLDALIAGTREMVRVLKPSGSIFVDLGDKYASYEGNRGQGGALSARVDPGRNRTPKGAGLSGGGAVRNKSLMLLPERYRIRCVDDLGLIARAVIVWAKPNGLPESVTDRVRRSHEDWVHLTKEPRYFTAIDEIREPHTMRPQRRPSGRPPDLTPRSGQPRQSWSTAVREDVGVDGNLLGKLPGSVWTIPTQPLRVPWGYGVSRGKIAAYFKEGGEAQAWLRRGARGERRSIRPLPDHFAAFPMEWPRRLIKGWAPLAGVCVECGEGRRPVAVADPFTAKAFAAERQDSARSWHGGNPATRSLGVPAGDRNRRITGYACACNEPIETPTGSRSGEDPTISEGKAGFKRPRGQGEGVVVTTRWEQRHFARQIASSPHRAEMEAELGRPLDHYQKTSSSSGRPLPIGVRDAWIARGWLTTPPPFVPPPTRKAVVLDLFGGTGTTAMVAAALGCEGISVDLSKSYCRLARWRTSDPAEMARAAQVKRPQPKVVVNPDDYDGDLLAGWAS